MRKKAVHRLAGVLMIQAALLWQPPVTAADECQVCPLACEWAYWNFPPPDPDCVWFCSCQCDANGDIIFDTFVFGWDYCPPPPPPPPNDWCWSNFDCADGYYCDADGRCKPWF